MTHDLEYYTRRTIDSLYEFLFDGPAYDPSTQAGSCCIKPYHGENGAANPTSFAESVSGGGGRAGRLASAVQDKVGSVTLSASSAAASLVSTIGNGNGGYNHAGSRTAGHHYHHDGNSGGFWHSTPTESTFSHWKSVLHDCWHSLTGHSLSSPDFWHQLQSRLGINHLARSWNLEPHIVFLLLLVPLMLLLLSWCLMLGAGNTSEEPRGPGRKSDPTKVGEKQNQSRPTYASMVAGGSSPTSNAGKGKKVQGSKKGGTQDNAGSIKSQNQLGNDNSISSWSALLGSTGFRGGEASSYKPIDIYAAMKSVERTITNIVEDTFAPGHDEGMVSNIIEEIVGPTEAQHERKEIGLDNKQDYIDNFPAIGEHEHSVNHIDKGRASRSGPNGPASSTASNSSAKIRVPHPYGAKEADRHRHQPHKSFHEIERESAPHQHPTSQISFAAKVMDFAQENIVMKSLDGISGGVLGAAMATFAAIANTVEAATTSFKENMPISVDEVAHDLRSSFDKAMEQGGLEGSGIDEQDDDSSCTPSNTTRSQSHKTESRSSGPSFSSSSSQCVKDNFGGLFSLEPAMCSNHHGSTSSSSHPITDNFEELSKGPAMVANPPRLRKRSVVQAHPGPAANIAAAKATTATAVPASAATPSPSHKAAVAPSQSKKSVASSPSDKSAAQASAPAPSKATAPSSNSAKNTSASKPTSAAPAKTSISIEDNASRPATRPVTQTNNSLSPAQKTSARKTSAQKNNVKGATTEAIGGAKKATSNAVEEAKDASGHVADDVKNIVESTEKAASKAAGDVKDGVKDLAKDAKKAAADEADDVQAAVNNVVVKTKGAAKETKDAGDTASHKAHELKEAVVEKAGEAVEQAKDIIDRNVVQPLKNAEEKVETTVKDTEKMAEGVVKNAAETAHHTKDAAVGKAGEVAHAAADTIRDVEKKVEDAAKSASATAHRTKGAAVERAGEVTHAAAEAVKDAEKQLEDAVKYAAEVTKEAKDTAVGRTSEVAQAAADAVRVAERRLEEAVKYAAEVAKEAKAAAVEKAGEMAHAAAGAVMDAERRLVDVARDADESFDEGSLIDADEALDETAHTTAAAAQSLVADTSAHIRSASPSEMAQSAMNEAVDEIADVAESLSSMFAGFKDSVARAFKDVKDMASHVGPALAPASISVSPAYATGHMEFSPTSSSSSSVFKLADSNHADSNHADSNHADSNHSDSKHAESKHKSATHASAASTATVAPASDASHKDASKQNQDGMIDGRSYSDVVKVTPVATPKLHAAKLPSGSPTTPATDDSSVHPHDEAITSSSADDQADAPPTEAQEYTVDEFGNKVPVVDARRDSGFDLLV